MTRVERSGEQISVRAILQSEVESLRTVVETIRQSLSIMCTLKSQPLFADYWEYFDRALIRLDAFDLDDRESMTALVAFSKEVEGMSHASLAALQGHGFQADAVSSAIPVTDPAAASPRLH